MGNLSDVNMDGVQPAADYSPLPAGEYTAAITASEIKQTKDFTGKYIKLEITIVDGQYKNRKLWQNLNLWNRSKEAVDMAKRELASIKKATGVTNPQDTSQLHGHPVIIKLGIKPASDGYDAQNVIKLWSPMATPEATPTAPSGRVWAPPPAWVAPPAPQPEIF